MKREDKAPILLFAFFWALYQSTFAQAYSYDGVVYALDVEFGSVSQLFHPNHLLFSFLFRLLYHLFQFLGYHGRAICLMQCLNALLGAAAVAIFGRTVSRRFGRERGILAASLFGVSLGLWSEAIDSGCYALAALGAVLLLEFLFGIKESSAFRTGLLHGVVALLHQMFILVVPAFMAAYFLETEKGFRNGVRYSLGVMVSAVLPYVAVVSIFHPGTWAQELSWILTPAGTPPSGHVFNRYWWTWGLMPNFRAWWAGFAQSFVAREGWDQAFLAAVLIFCIVWSVRHYRSHTSRWQGVAGAWIWVMALNVFQFFFYHAVRYTLLFMPPLLYLLAAATTDLRAKKWVPMALVLILIIGITNYVMAIAPAKSLNTDRLLILWIENHIQPADFLLFEGRGEMSIQNVYMAYFAPEIPARSLYGYLLDQYEQPETHMEGLTARMTETWRRGGRVWVEKGLLDPGHEERVEAQSRIVKGAVQNWFRGFRSGRELRGPDGYRLVELRPAFQAK